MRGIADLHAGGRRGEVGTRDAYIIAEAARSRAAGEVSHFRASLCPEIAKATLSWGGPSAEWVTYQS